VDRDAVARAGRRAQAEEALADERERELVLRQQVTEVVLEEDGPRVDAAALAGLDADDVRRVRAALGQLEPDPDEADEALVADEDPFADELYVELDDRPDDPEEDELGRLGREIDESQRIQRALETFIAALDRPPEAP
jgi:hypothetical protein